MQCNVPQKIIGQQSEGLLIRGFDYLIYSTYMTIGLMDPRIIHTLPPKNVPSKYYTYY